MYNSFDLVVASHLRWSFVWQRPQQLLSRLARDHRILFVEEPVFADDPTDERFELEEAMPNITVLAPRVSRPGRDGVSVWADRERISRQVNQAAASLRFNRKALWFYTPLPEFLLHSVEPDLVVYDVMDELSMFKFAPPELKEQEARLLRRSDLVFTGGASLFESKKPYNRNTHLFASGVDAKHYAKACDDLTDVPEYIRSLDGPIATYIGVIDERMDYEIIASMAARRSDVQFLMCGPVVKVDPNELPKAPNLHYLGQQQYADLPCILKGSDICLMPFARNDATRFISPTKTLEYMATHRPIVSTPIRDVERFYSDIVYLAQDSDEFVAQIDAALNESHAERERRRIREDKILVEHEWDTIAANMDRLMSDALSRKTEIVAKTGLLIPTPRSVRTPAAPYSVGSGQ